MTSAKFGRMRLGECVTQDFGFLGCYQDVLPFFDSACSGREECNVEISGKNQDLVQNAQCNKNLVSYLEAEYICQKGICVC